MNPSKIFLRRGGTQYRLKDKVMQIRNDYDKEVFNGDIGTITKVDMEEREVKAQLLKEAVDEVENKNGSNSNASVNAQQKKEKMIVYKGSIQLSMVCETPAAYVGNLWKRLSQSKFRSSFSLKANDRSYVTEKGMEKVREHACDFIRKRLAPAEIPNDGKQTPMRGHPVFVAQHATATCCRGCLEKWHHIPKGRELTEPEQEYVVNVIMEWISREMRK